MKKNNIKPAESVEEFVERSATKRSDALDELGEFNFSKDVELTEPKLGVHDMFDFDESGIRSVDDFGIVGASVDNVRAAKNIDSVYARLGSVMSESAQRFALEGVENYDYLLKGLTKELADAGEIGYRTAGGRHITHKEVKEEGLRLAGIISRMDDPADIKNLLDEYRTDKAGIQLSEEAAQAVLQSAKDTFKLYTENEAIASALVQTSVAGQASDIALGSRLSAGTPGSLRAKEQLVDKLKYLMIENGRDGYLKARALKMRDMNAPFSKADMKAEYDTKMKQLFEDAEKFGGTLDAIRAERPEMLDTFALAYEVTDGKIDTINKLNNYVQNSLGVLDKALVDGSPEIPSVFMKGFWSNVYNNVLSAAATPIRAISSTAAVLIERPVTTFAGAMVSGDGQTMRKAVHAYQGFFEATSRGLKYFGETFRRTGLDPNYVGVPGRENLIRKNEKQIEILNSFADMKAAKGDFGPQFAMAQVEQIQALADHPVLRLGNRLMQSTDGFTQAFIGSIDARSKAFDMVQAGRIDGDMIEDMSKKAYKEIWTMEDGREIISDKAVKRASSEIAMNLDSKANDAISGFLRSYPGLKPFLLFTRTPINMLGFTASHNPLGLFIKQMNQYSLPFEKMPIEKVNELLSARGVDVSDPQMAALKYAEIRAELKGRKAVGSLAVTAGVGLFLSDNITGNGHYDRQKQQARREFDWKPRSIRVPGGQWVSYDGLGAISDWLAVTADIFDNFDTLHEGDFTQLLNAAGFVISASLTDKTFLAGVEPIYDILSGNPAAINRWASSFLPSTVVPGSSQIAELGRLISPNLRIVEEQLGAMIANRTPLKATLPEQYDWIDGGKIGMPDNLMSRIWNTYGPWKVNGKISEVKEFLTEVEFDGRPNMRTDGRGVELSPEETSELYNIMGQDGYFKKEVKKIMNTVDGKDFRTRYKKYRTKDGELPSLKEFERLHYRINKAMNEAKARALAKLSTSDAIEQTRNEQALEKDKQRSLFIPTR